MTHQQQVDQEHTAVLFSYSSDRINSVYSPHSAGNINYCLDVLNLVRMKSATHILSIKKEAAMAYRTRYCLAM